ncbi:hypothetical protein DIE07_22150 [Burkholderia sp. Bp9002]|nr:hypothetical protein DIE07_22150 [Burkholderia sp. Bp9002]
MIGSIDTMQAPCHAALHPIVWRFAAYSSGPAPAFAPDQRRAVMQRGTVVVRCSTAAVRHRGARGR